MSEDIRELVKVVQIDSLHEIVGADKIEAARVGGWTVVVQKGLYKPGDKALYFEIDSCLPLSDSRFEHLRERGVKVSDGKEYHRLKTIKLRGVVSQGMLMPVGEFRDEVYAGALSETDTLTTRLGIVKYDDIDPVATRGAGAVGSFPTHVVRKTDSERIQNLFHNWDEIKRYEWLPTEKIDGCSLTIARLDGELKVCSRNWEVRKDSGVFGAMYQKYIGIWEELPEGMAIQAEIAGPGIQGNRLGLTEQRIFIFNVTDYGAVVPRQFWLKEWRELAVPSYVEYDLPDTPEEAIEQADGIKSLVSKDRLAEGIVWVNTDGFPLMCLGDRPQFKVISTKYLLKEKD